jgi:hypothetical protein
MPPPEHKNTFALVAIVKNEARYLLEWLAFYDCIGVRHFVIFDNESTDETRNILKCYAQFVDIEIIHWPSCGEISAQLEAYNYFIETYRNEFDFAAFFDLDEFLVPHNGVAFPDFLDRIPDNAGAIGFNQRVFGSSGELTYKTDLVLRRFKRCSEPLYDENKYYKSMYRLRDIDSVTNVHGSSLARGQFSFPDFSPLPQDAARPGAAAEICCSDFQLNHYILKSLEEFRGKQRRGCVDEIGRDKLASRYEDGFFTGREPIINKSICHRADPWIPKVIAKLMAVRAAAIRNASRDYVHEYYAGLLRAIRDTTPEMTADWR